MGKDKERPAINGRDESEHESPIITLFGPKNSGKTVFLNALYYAINEKGKKWRIIPGDHSQKFIEDTRQELLESHHFPEPTDPGDQKRKFEFSLQAPGFMGWGFKDIECNILDPAGEFFEDPDLEMSYQKIITYSIRKSRGLICLIDPEPKKKDYFSLLAKHFRKMRDSFYSRFRRGFHPIPIPMSLCISKMDMNDEFINDPGKFDIEKFAIKIMGKSSFNAIRNYFKYPKVFGISSIGWDEQGRRNYYVDENGHVRPIGEPNPVNVFEAVEWILKYKRVKSYDTR